MDNSGAVLILNSGTHVVPCYPAFKLVELNLYAPVLGSAFGSFVAADRLAVTEAVTQDNAYTKAFLEFMILPQIHTST
jgi:hypothetical protein